MILENAFEDESVQAEEIHVFILQLIAILEALQMEILVKKMVNQVILMIVVFANILRIITIKKYYFPFHCSFAFFN